MDVLDKFWDHDYKLVYTEPKVYCKYFEENSGDLEILCLPMMQSLAKAINVVYYHFREYVLLGLISIYLVSTGYQVADIPTNPLSHNTFVRHQIRLWVS